MKLLHYISMTSKTPEEATYRSLNVGIVEDDSQYLDIIKKYDNKDIVKTIEKCNKRLKESFKGNYKLGFYVSEDENIDHSNINTKKRERISRKIDEFNNALAILQKEFERNLQQGNLQDSD